MEERLDCLLITGCRRTPSRTHWPLLLQSYPSGKNSTPENRTAASAWRAVASNGRLQEPHRLLWVLNGPHHLPPTPDEPVVGVILTLFPIARPARIEPRNDEQGEHALEGGCPLRPCPAPSCGGGLISLVELAGGYRACPPLTRCSVSRKLTPSSTLRAEIVPPILAM